MNRLNKTESAVFSYCMFSLFLKDSFFEIILCLMKAQVARKKVSLHNLFFVNYARFGAGNSLQYLICLNQNEYRHIRN